MAKSKFADAPLPEEERGEYERWLPGSHRKMIRLQELHEHPDNWELVGRIDESRKKSLTEDVKKSGIREDLQVWLRDGKLVVVSGHERMNIARELGIDELPCVKVEFKSESEARRHIFATNKHRKQVKLPPPEIMKSMFPPEEYPLMYADLRANYAYESEKTRGSFTSEEREEAREKREKEREEQAALRKQAGELLGYSEHFTKEVVKKAARSIREEKEPEFVPEEPRKPTADEKRDFALLKVRIRELGEKIEAKEDALKALRGEIRELKKEREKWRKNRAKLAWLFPGEES